MTDTNPNQRPFPRSYWLIPGKFLAGEYPGASEAQLAELKIGRLLDAGIDYFIDLTEEDDPLEPYEPVLKSETGKRGVNYTYQHLPIIDFDVPTGEHMCLILDTLDRALEEGKRVYLHCWGGSGRTGTVVGCWLVRHGKTGFEALEELTRLRQVIPEYERRNSPETGEQVAMVLAWQAGK